MSHHSSPNVPSFDSGPAFLPTPLNFESEPESTPPRITMKTRVAVRDKTHRFQVIPLRDIAKQRLEPPPTFSFLATGSKNLGRSLSSRSELDILWGLNFESGGQDIHSTTGVEQTSSNTFSAVGSEIYSSTDLPMLPCKNSQTHTITHSTYSIHAQERHVGPPEMPHSATYPTTLGQDDCEHYSKSHSLGTDIGRSHHPNPVLDYLALEKMPPTTAPITTGRKHRSHIKTPSADAYWAPPPLSLSPLHSKAWIGDDDNHGNNKAVFTRSRLAVAMNSPHEQISASKRHAIYTQSLCVPLNDDVERRKVKENQQILRPQNCSSFWSSEDDVIATACLTASAVATSRDSQPLRVVKHHTKDPSHVDQPLQKARSRFASDWDVPTTLSTSIKPARSALQIIDSNVPVQLQPQIPCFKLNTEGSALLSSHPSSPFVVSHDVRGHPVPTADTTWMATIEYSSCVLEMMAELDCAIQEWSVWVWV